MIDDLRARFLPRFIEVARKRIGEAKEACAAADESGRAKVASVAHALAGEAAMLEIRAIERLAREVEATARGASDSAKLVELLDALAREIEQTARV